MDASARGSFVWHELMTHDPAKAAAFYSGITGWKSQKAPSGLDYTLLMSGKDPVAGLTALPAATGAEGGASAWLGYIGVSDVDAIVAEAQRLGARIIKAATDIPNTGRFAVLADPQGVRFGIFRATDTSMSSSADKYFAWHELVTTDLSAALRFYRTLFGWDEIRRMNMGAMGDYVIFGWDGTERGGAMSKPAEAPVPYWIAYQSVADARKMAGVITSRGGTVIMGPHRVPDGGWIVLAIDPTGALFAVHSSAAAASAAPKSAARPAKKATRKKAAPKPKVKPASRVKPKKKGKPKTKARAKAATGPKNRVTARKKKATKKRPVVRGKMARKPVKKPARKPAKKK